MRTKILLLGVLVLGFTLSGSAQVRNTTPKKVVVVTKKADPRKIPSKVIKKKTVIVYKPAPVRSKMVRETIPPHRKSFHFKAR